MEHRLGQSASPLTTTSEAQLVTWARNGEQLACAELCRRHREKVLGVVWRITRNLDDAEDVLQDSWMRAFTHIGTFDGRSAFSTWVTRIAINSALGMIKKSGKHIESRWMIPPILIGPDLRRYWNFREIRKSDAWKGKDSGSFGKRSGVCPRSCDRQ